MTFSHGPIDNYWFATAAAVNEGAGDAKLGAEDRDQMPFSNTVVEETAREMYGRALKKYPPDLVAAMRAAAERETSPVAKHHFELMLTSIDKGEHDDRPICQDTGMQTFWLRVGTRLKFDGYDLQNAIREGVRRWSSENEYRKTVVHPVTRKKVGEQVGLRHPTIYWDWLDGKDYLEMMMLSKGSGSENQGFLGMLVPAQGLSGVKQFIIDSVLAAGGQFCPPGVAGIGIGGTFDSVARMSKEALLRPLDTRNEEQLVADLEDELLEAINATKIGPMGLSGDTTVLKVNIEYGVTHETQNPVALNLQCWAHRKAGARIHSNGKVEFIRYFGGEAYE